MSSYFASNFKLDLNAFDRKNGFPLLESSIFKRSKGLLGEVNHGFHPYLCLHSYFFLCLSKISHSLLNVSAGPIPLIMIMNVKELLRGQYLLFRKIRSYQIRVFYSIMLVFKLDLVKIHTRKEKMHFRIGGTFLSVTHSLKF